MSSKPESPAESSAGTGPVPAPGALPAAKARPMGLLYTILRHGRGLSHEEAHRRSFFESTGGQPPKAA